MIIAPLSTLPHLNVVETGQKLERNSDLNYPAPLHFWFLSYYSIRVSTGLKEMNENFAVSFTVQSVVYPYEFEKVRP